MRESARVGAGFVHPPIKRVIDKMTSGILLAGASPGAGLLGNLASNLAASGDLPDLLKRFLEPLLRISGADAGAVRAMSDDGDQLELISSVGLPPQALLAEGSVHHLCGACGKASAGESPIWASELAGCARLGSAGALEAGFQRMVAVPLRHRGRVLGIYSLFFAHGDGPGADVLAVLKSVGELLGLALNNARLEQQHLRTTVMHERQMMAAEVHDSIAQTLAFVRMRLPLMEEAVRSRDDAGMKRYLGDMRSAVGEAHSSLRAIISEFRVPPDPRGLIHALHDRVEQLRERHGVEAQLVNHAPGIALTTAQETQVLHIVSEALANIGRHAGATQAWVSLMLHDGQVEVRVEDNGNGLPEASAKSPVAAGHHGIEIMRDRARRLGGKLDLRPRPGGGTTLELDFPMAQVVRRA